VDVDKGPY